MIDAKEHLPIVLPEVEKYLPTEDGKATFRKCNTLELGCKNNKVVSNEMLQRPFDSAQVVTKKRKMSFRAKSRNLKKIKEFIL